MKPAGPPVHLPVTEWPDADRVAWAELFREGDVLDGRGEAWHWAEATRRTNAKHYARWLGWLATSGQLDAGVAPWMRITPERVLAYSRSLIDRLAPRTAASAVIGLKCVAKRLHPAGDWRWLMDATNRLDVWATPSVDRRPQVLPAPIVFDGALRELARLDVQPMSPRDRVAFRDALIVALLTACPMRLRNLTQIEIGEHLQRTGPEWSLSFKESETKSRQPLRYLVPAALAPWLDIYLSEVRPGFRDASACRHLWLSSKRGSLAYETHYMRISRITKRLFGIAINPHSFRSIAATSLAEHSAEAALFARPLLGHRLPATTEQFYVKANQVAAGRRINDILAAVRGTPLPGRRS